MIFEEQDAGIQDTEMRFEMSKIQMRRIRSTPLIARTAYQFIVTRYIREPVVSGGRKLSRSKSSWSGTSYIEQVMCHAKA